MQHIRLGIRRYLGHKDLDISQWCDAEVSAGSRSWSPRSPRHATGTWSRPLTRPLGRRTRYGVACPARVRGCAASSITVESEPASPLFWGVRDCDELDTGVN